MRSTFYLFLFLFIIRCYDIVINIYKSSFPNDGDELLLYIFHLFDSSYSKILIFILITSVLIAIIRTWLRPKSNQFSNVKEKLNNTSMKEFLISLLLIYSVIWLCDNLPHLIRLIKS